MPNPGSNKQHPESDKQRVSDQHEQIERERKAVVKALRAYLDWFEADQDPARNGDAIKAANNQIEESKLELARCQSSVFSEDQTGEIQSAPPTKQAECFN